MVGFAQFLECERDFGRVMDGCGGTSARRALREPRAGHPCRVRQGRLVPRRGPDVQGARTMVKGDWALFEEDYTAITLILQTSCAAEARAA